MPYRFFANLISTHIIKHKSVYAPPLGLVKCLVRFVKKNIYTRWENVSRVPSGKTNTERQVEITFFGWIGFCFNLGSKSLCQVKNLFSWSAC